VRKSFYWALCLGIVAMVGCGKPEAPPAPEPTVTPAATEPVAEPVVETDTMGTGDTVAMDTTNSTAYPEPAKK